MRNDPWLERWLPLIHQHAGKRQILEIGCGWGWDTQVLTDAGLNVFAIDLRDVSQAQTLAPKATYQKVDVQDFLRTSLTGYPVIIASLSLHYLPWEQTHNVIESIYQTLEPGGIFLFRVNSTEDVNHGAVGHPEIDRHFYQVGEHTKRFFDADDLKRLFGDKHKWKPLNQEKLAIDRFKRLKTVWELVFERE